MDKSTVFQVAGLARIAISEAESVALVNELSAILHLVGQLQEVDTTSVEPMSSVSNTQMNWRDDIINDGNYSDQILANAPESSGGFFLVPKVIE